MPSIAIDRPHIDRLPLTFPPASEYDGVFELGGDQGRERALTAHLEAAAPGTPLWCLHCERAFARGDIRLVDDSALCAYADCEAGPLDFWDWQAYRSLVAAAPAVPAAGKVYGLALTQAA